jgi:transcriptional regulator with XRE-family HTH domain
MENGVKQRIKAVIEEKTNSVYAFSREIGIKQTTISDYLNNGKTPSWAVVRGIIATYSDISVEWLLRGDGPMYISDIPSTDHDDSDEVLELKAEITRLRAERDELVRKLAISERRIDKLIDILHQEPEPRFSIVAEEQTYNHRNNIEL